MAWFAGPGRFPPSHARKRNRAMSTPSPLPTEGEIRDAARQLGLADEHGNYRQRDRNRIAAAVQRARQDAAEAADPLTGTTAAILGRLDTELFTNKLGPEARARVLAAAATHLLETQGLRLDSPREEQATP